MLENSKKTNLIMRFHSLKFFLVDSPVGFFDIREEKWL